MDITALLIALGKSIFINLSFGACCWLLFLCIKPILDKRPGILFSFAFTFQSILLITFLSCIYFFTQQGQSAEVFFVNEILNPSLRWNDWILESASMVYILLLIYFTIEFIWCYRYSKSLRKVQLRIPVEWRLFLSEQKALIGIKKNIQLFLSNVVDTPLTMGWLQPIILIPVSVFTQLTPAQLEAVIIHELAHIKRKDYLIQLVATAVDVVLCFNPFSKMLLRMMDAEREKACDDLVMQFKYSPISYAEALLSFARMQQPNVFAAAAKGSTTAQLLHRIQRLLKPNFTPNIFRISPIHILKFSIAIFLPLYMLSLQKIPSQSVNNLDTLPQANHTKKSSGEINYVSIKNKVQSKDDEPIIIHFNQLMPSSFAQVIFEKNMPPLPPSPPPTIQIIASSKKVITHTSIAAQIEPTATNEVEKIVDKSSNQMAYTYTDATPKIYSDITTKEEADYQLSVVESLNKSPDEVAYIIGQMNTQANATNNADNYSGENAMYQVIHTGSTQYNITAEMFDALVDAWNNKKALTMPLANGDKILSFVYDDAASTSSKRYVKVTTRDNTGKEHQFTLEIKIFQ